MNGIRTALVSLMLALPARLLWIGRKLPTEPVTAAATGHNG